MDFQCPIFPWPPTKHPCVQDYWLPQSSRFLSQSHKHGVHPFPLGSMLDHLDHRNRPWCLLKWPFHIITSIGFSIGFHRHIIEHEAHTIVSDKEVQVRITSSLALSTIRFNWSSEKYLRPASIEMTFFMAKFFRCFFCSNFFRVAFCIHQSILSCFEMVDQRFWPLLESCLLLPF